MRYTVAEVSTFEKEEKKKERKEKENPYYRLQQAAHYKILGEAIIPRLQ